MSLRVLIAGGGLGGLTLAHGLRKHGLDPVVFECGPARLDLATSYRIHINADGSRALHATLPDEQWRALETHAAASPRGLGFATEHLRPLAFVPEIARCPDGTDRSHPISRTGLRKLLLRGLEQEGRVRFESRVVRFEHATTGQVVAHLADGRQETGDVLVGADGSASAIRHQLLPAARVVATGVASIAGKVYLDAERRARIGPGLLSQMTIVLPTRGMAMFLAPFVRPGDAGASGRSSALDLPEHLFWVTIGRAESFGFSFTSSRQHAPEVLRDASLRHSRGFHPLLRELIGAADASSLLAVPLHTAEPVSAWQPTRVTLLGDAIHTMTPLQGLGGNTALVDAERLCRQLVEVDRGRRELVEAIGEYESEMRRYGFEAVQRSLDVSSAVASTNVVGRLGFRATLRIADRLPWLHQKMFSHEPLVAAA